MIILLAIIALAVSIWQAILGDWSRAGCWLLIVVYWITLTIKNILDYMRSRK